MIFLWLATRAQSEDKDVKFASSLGMGLILWQGFLGYITVRMDNEHWSVAIHLVSALAFTLSMIWYLILRWKETDSTPAQMRIVAKQSSKKIGRILLHWGPCSSFCWGVCLYDRWSQLWVWSGRIF